MPLNKISQLLDEAMVLALGHPECIAKLEKGEVMFSGNSMREGDLVVRVVMAKEEVLKEMWEANKKAKEQAEV